MFSSVSTVLLIISALVAISCAMPVQGGSICSLLRCFGGPCCTASTEATTTTSNDTCGENMHHDECGTMCPAHCGGPKIAMCMMMCKNGCFCDDGFVLYKPNGVCVRTEDCPKTED